MLAFLSVSLIGGALLSTIGSNASAVVVKAEAVVASRDGLALKGNLELSAPDSEAARRIIRVSTVRRVEGRDIVRVRPFAHVRSNLAAPVSPEVAAQVPDFDALDLFSDTPHETVDVDAVSIYAAEVDGEVAITVRPFPLGDVEYDDASQLSTATIEQYIRASVALPGGDADGIGPLAFVDPARFDTGAFAFDGANDGLVEIAPLNVSSIDKTMAQDSLQNELKVVTVKEGSSFRGVLIDAGASPESAAAAQSALLANYSFDFRAGQTLVLELSPDGSADGSSLTRVSLYQGDDYIATAARSDSGAYVAAEEPASGVPTVNDVVAEAAAAPLPSVYEGIWQTGLALDVPEPVIRNLIHILSYRIDYQRRLSPDDALEIVYGAETEEETAELLFASLSIGSDAYRLYRFRSPEDGAVGFYDAEGNGAEKFLLRKPVAEARFSSAFGMRRHPITRRNRLHSGADWAAPTGTPIMAAGNGVLKSVGTRSSYGRIFPIRSDLGAAIFAGRDQSGGGGGKLVANLRHGSRLYGRGDRPLPRRRCPFHRACQPD